jgi:hypothetical protein
MKYTKSNDRLLIENASLRFKNFEGRAGKFNASGDRNFCIVIDEEFGDQISRDGWNVKTYVPKMDGDGDQPQSLLYIPVKVGYKFGSPNIVMVSGDVRTRLTEDTVYLLDYAYIEWADVLCNPYRWEKGGESGTTAYLKSLYAYVEEDELQKKYNNPDSNF